MQRKQRIANGGGGREDLLMTGGHMKRKMFWGQFICPVSNKCC